MRKLSGAVILLLALCKTGVAAPQHVMSLTVCTDELLMDLASPGQIASLSSLSREKAALKLWPEAAQLPVNHNTAEEVLAQKPDLVLTLDYASTGLRPLLEKSGIRILQVPQPENFDQIRAVMRQVGDAIGARDRAEALIARMDEELREVAAHRPARPIRVAEWGTGGYVPGANGLFGAMLQAAGATSIEKGNTGYYDVESLIAAKPDVLIYGDSYAGLPSLHDDQDYHPALTGRFPRVSYSPLYGCGVPQTATVTRQLQTALIAAVKR